MRVVSILGIICLLALQYVWWRNAYRAVEQDFMYRSMDCLKKATDKAVVLYMDSTNNKMKIANSAEGEKIIRKYKPISRHSASNTSEISYILEEALFLNGYPISEQRIDRYFGYFLNEKFGFVPKHEIKVCRLSNVIDEKDHSKFNRIAYGNGHDTIYHQFGFMTYTVVVLPSPMKLYLRKGAFILIVSIILVLLIGTILVFQYISLNRERKFAEFIIEYTRMMTHDLRIPVSGVQMIFQMFQKNKFSKPEMKENYILEGVNLSKKILLNLDNMLYMSKSEKMDLPIYLLEMDIRPFMEKIIDGYRIRNYYPKVLRIESHYEPADFKCRFDTKLMENVLCNLLENAIKYTHIDTHIELWFIRVGNEITIKIKDNGMGMSVKDQKRIFELFERGSSSKNKQYPGFGIGLHFVERAIKAHGGKLTVKSELGEGAEFTIKYTAVEVS